MTRRAALAGFVLLVLASSATAGETLHTISWRDEQSAQHLGKGTLVQDPVEPGQIIEIDSQLDADQVIPLASIDRPGVTTNHYAIVGRVRYQDVAGDGFLRMWNHFPDGNAYFSRQWGQTGRSRAMHGSCGWRDFELPFQLDSDDSKPERISLELVLPGRGRVWLGGVRLVQFASSRAAARASGAWWTDQQGGLVGGIIGSVFGCLGGLIGALAGAGRARRFVLGAMLGMGLAGGLLLITGAVALASQQPYGVWYPLVVGGGVSLILGLSMRRGIARRYEAHELRRMRALDA